MKTLFDGITQSHITAPRLKASILERPGSSESAPVVFIHGNVSSSIFWQPTMLSLPHGIRAIAIDLRGFGDSDTLPIDAKRGLEDFADDVASVLQAMGIARAHFVGWSMGGGVLMQLMLSHGSLFETLTLVAPVSPFGFGGTVGADGRELSTDGAGTGGGGANPEFVAMLDAHDASDTSPTTPRNVYRGTYVKNFADLPHEDIWVESMLTTKTGVDNYPGDSVASENWPGFASGTRGVLNAMAPGNFNASGIVNIDQKPPVLWIHGADDAIVSNDSLFDLNTLGKLGVIPGWPGEEIAPSQPMITQTRAVLDEYADNGGRYSEVEFADCGHSPHLEYAEKFSEALHAHIA
jgi:pimeloyl-ACP methyl ester carboxylesterase